MEQSIKRAHGQVPVWIHLAQSPSKNMDYRTTRWKSTVLPKKNTAILCHLLLVSALILMLISWYGHTLKQLLKMLPFDYIWNYLIICNSQKYPLCQMIHENHETTLLFYLFAKGKVIWLKLYILRSNKPIAFETWWPKLTSLNWHRTIFTDSSLTTNNGAWIFSTV